MLLPSYTITSSPSQLCSAKKSRTFLEARDHLATVTSLAENDWLLKTFSSMRPEGRWIGGFQPNESREPGSGWRWVTGEPFAYRNWGPDEPNNTENWENATEFNYRYKGQWNDATGTYLVFYIVEYEPTGLYISVHYDQSKAHTSGSIIDIKLQISNVNGRNASSENPPVRAVSLTKSPQGDRGEFPPNGFRFIPEFQGYIYEVNIKDFATGTWNQNLTASSDRTVHIVSFRIR